MFVVGKLQLFVLFAFIFGDVQSSDNSKPSSLTPRFARFSTRYRCKSEEEQKKKWIGNFGDCVQGLAVEKLFDDMGYPSIGRINREEMDIYDGEPTVVVMQGWFGPNMTFVWSDNVIPVFVGFHLQIAARKLFVNSGAVEKMKNLKTAIGCRDRQTANYLRSLGVNAYFSGCLSLTFPRRTEEPAGGGKVFIIDAHRPFHEKIPKALKENAVYTSQRHYFPSACINDSEYAHFEKKGKKLFDRYKTEARLVITSRIHVAMPCVAIGIPVVFLHNDSNDCRFDVLRGFVKVHTLADVDTINWNPTVPNIEAVKDLIRNNAISRIEEASKQYFNNEGLITKPKKRRQQPAKNKSQKSVQPKGEKKEKEL